jgi:L-rhamnose-H+ transport protein
MNITLIGIVAALVSGVLNGSFALPMKSMVKWSWENIWLLWAVWALVILPVAIALLTVPDLIGVYRAAGDGVLIRTFLLGAGWGLGAITFGLGLYLVGFSLGFSIIMGVTAVAGALIPMLIQHPADLLTRGGGVILLGMVLTMAGVAACGKAGGLKQVSSNNDEATAAGRKTFAIGLIVCFASGLFNAMLNLAFVSGAPIAEQAGRVLAGAPLVHFRAANPMWALALLGGFCTNLLYCGYRLIANGTIRKYRAAGTGHYGGLAFLMGLLWMSGVCLYGAGAGALGKLGATVAWVILMASTIVVGNFWGVFSGEWRQASSKAIRLMTAGVLLLVGAVVLVSIGNYLLQPPG